MARLASARRHAQAVFEIALEHNELEKWRSDMLRLSEVLQNPEMVALLEAPRVRLEQKMKVLDASLEGVAPLAKNLAYLLVARGRLRLMKDIASELERLADAHYGVEHAQVTTGVPLEEPARAKLQSSLEAMTGKKIIIETRVDPSIIGGIVAQIGDLLVDGSVRTRLDSLRRSLASK